MKEGCEGVTKQTTKVEKKLICILVILVLALGCVFFDMLGFVDCGHYSRTCAVGENMDKYNGVKFLGAQRIEDKIWNVHIGLEGGYDIYQQIDLGEKKIIGDTKRKTAKWNYIFVKRTHYKIKKVGDYLITFEK
jgi:hypothetical protein